MPPAFHDSIPEPQDEAPVPDPLDLEDARVGRYEVDGHLGGGGMGIVYRARDPELGRAVVLKFLPPHLSGRPEVEERFAREPRAAAALDHPHIATIYEIGRAESGATQGQRYIAMAFCEGETLKEKLAREGPRPVGEALDYAEQIAEGLSAAHEVSVVHRDVKPANVMVTEAGEVKLLDFGLARLADATRLTGTGQQLGTVGYMSPKPIEGVRVARKSVQLAPRRPITLWLMSLWPMEVGLYDAAEAWCRRVLKIESNYLFTVRDLATIQRLRDQHEQSLRTWERYLDGLNASPSAAALKRAADAALATGRPERAKAWLERIPEVRPQDAADAVSSHTAVLRITRADPKATGTAPPAPETTSPGADRPPAGHRPVPPWPPRRGRRSFRSPERPFAWRPVDHRARR